MMTVELFLEKVDERLAEILSDDFQSVVACGNKISNPLAEGMRYAVFGGGKRIRPTAVYLAAEAVGCDFSEDRINALLTLACALELVHSYSLVHDDLPAMDNDDYRRGKLSVHKKFGEANGILIGDALLTEAARIAAIGTDSYAELGFGKCATILTTCASAMAAGQAYDLNLTAEDLKSTKHYFNTYALKTGALFKAAFVSGAILGGGSETEIECAADYAESFGLIFQLTDDVLDKDKEISMVNVLGEEGTLNLVKDETAKAIKSTDAFKKPQPLVKLLKSLANRKN